MKRFTKVLIYIGIILAWCNQISAMRPILKDGEMPPDEARLEPDETRLEPDEARLEPDREPKVDTDFTREEERNPDTGDDEYIFEEKPELINGTIANSTILNTSSVWAENQFSDFEKSSAGLIGMALLPLISLAFKV
jgi:hypothetical protein